MRLCVLRIDREGNRVIDTLHTATALVKPPKILISYVILEQMFRSAFCQSLWKFEVSSWLRSSQIERLAAVEGEAPPRFLDSGKGKEMPQGGKSSASEKRLQYWRNSLLCSKDENFPYSLVLPSR